MDGSEAQQRMPPARILVAEDDLIIADYLGEVVRDTGYVLLGPVSSVSDALHLVQARVPDAALLDYRLSDGSAAPVAQALTASNVPFALCTGFEEHELPSTLATVPRLTKPFGEAQVERILRALLSMGYGRSAQPARGGATPRDTAPRSERVHDRSAGPILS